MSSACKIIKRIARPPLLPLVSVNSNNQQALVRPALGLARLAINHRAVVSGHSVQQSLREQGFSAKLRKIQAPASEGLVRMPLLRAVVACSGKTLHNLQVRDSANSNNLPLPLVRSVRIPRIQERASVRLDRTTRTSHTAAVLVRSRAEQRIAH